MKKFLVVLMILAVAGGLFAQGLVISGSLKTGMTIDNDGAAFVNHSGDDENRLDINGSFAVENFGAKFNLRFYDDLGTGSDPFSNFKVSNAYAWVNLFGGMAKVSGGLIDDGVWGTGGDKDWGFATGAGLRLEVTPLEGLNFGLFIPGDIKSNDGDYDKDDKVNIADTFSELVIGASFSNDMIGIGAAVDIGGRDNNDAVGLAGNKLSAFTAIVGLNLKMVENLTASIEAYLYSTSKKNESFSKDGFGVWLTQKAEYAFAENFRAGLKLHEQFYPDVDGYLLVGAWAGYDINALITAALDALNLRPVLMQMVINTMMVHRLCSNLS